MLIYRLSLLLVCGITAPTALAQHAIQAYPNPYDEAVHDTLVLRNDGADPVTLDSLRFASSLSGESHGLGWSLQYVAYLDGGEAQGNLVCDPLPFLPCDDQLGLFGSTLTPTDSVAIYSLRAYCAVCRGGLNDTLLVYGGGAPEPLSVEILNGEIMVSVEDDAPALSHRVEVYPNPTRGRASLRLNLSAPSEVEVCVYDGKGRLVVGPEHHVTEVGENRIPLSLASLSVGLYHVRVRSVTRAGETWQSHRAVLVLE